MNKKLSLFLLILVLITVVGIIALPTLLKSVPSRYAARLPQPLREIAVPKQESAVLPTVIAPVNAALLLAPTSEPTPTAVSLPPTISPTKQPAINAAVADATATLTPIAPPTPTPTPPPLPPAPTAYRLTEIDHKFQTWNNCGPATLAMTLSYFGLNVGQEDTAVVLKPNPEDRNVSPQEMADYVNNETDFRAIQRANGSAETLRQLIAHDIPVILEIGIEPPGEYRWMGWYGHYLLVVAYDDALEQFWVYDSWFGTSETPLENATTDGRILAYDQLETYWPHFNRNYIAVYAPSQSDDLAAVLGDDLDDASMWSNALTTVQADAANAPDNAFHWFNLGTIYNALGQYEQAAVAFDQALAIGLPWRMLWYQFGPYEAYYQTERYEDVLLLTATTLKDRPYFEESYYYQGLAQAALGDNEGARSSLEKAVDLNANFLPAAIALENLLQK